MKRALFLLALLAACSSSKGADEIDDPDVAGSTTSPDGTPYPTENIGMLPRAGTRPGNVIANLTFRGYKNGDRAGGMQIVSLADYYDPTGHDHKVLQIMAGASWCTICAAEADEMVANADALRNEGAVMLHVLVNGVTPHYGPSLTELDQWTVTHHTTFDVLVDVRARRLTTSMGLGDVPWNALIDTRTMEILHASAGAPEDEPAYVRLALNWVATHPR